MIEHFLYSFLFMFSVACFVWLLYCAIQPEQLFGKWQNVLRAWNEKDSAFYTMLAKWGGDCQLCYSHAMAFLSIPVYLVYMYGFGVWAINGILLNAIWFIMYWAISTNLNLFFITKLWR